jgi:hypothetical protein
VSPTSELGSVFLQTVGNVFDTIGGLTERRASGVQMQDDPRALSRAISGTTAVWERMKSEHFREAGTQQMLMQLGALRGKFDAAEHILMESKDGAVVSARDALKAVAKGIEL